MKRGITIVARLSSEGGGRREEGEERYRDMLFAADMNYGTWMPWPCQTDRRQQRQLHSHLYYREGGWEGGWNLKKRSHLQGRTEEKSEGRREGERDGANNVDIN